MIVKARSRLRREFLRLRSRSISNGVSYRICLYWRASKTQGAPPLALYALSGDDIFTALLLIGLILLAIRGLAWNQVKSL